MFQTFDTTTTPATGPVRVTAVRAVMASLGIDALLVPRADEHQGEYVSPSAERLQWLTGFSGSAGLAVITAKTAALFVDGRYTLQARAQSDAAAFQIQDLVNTDWLQWLAGELSPGGSVGYDPWLHTANAIATAITTGKSNGLVFKSLSKNPVDRAWGRERPPPRLGQVVVHPIALAGVPAAEKIAGVQKALAADKQDAVILTQPDSICWLFNIRGSDLGHTPVVLAFAIVPASGKADLFIDAAKVPVEARKHLGSVARLHAPGKLAAMLAALKTDGRKVRLDPAGASQWFVAKLGKAASHGGDPCLLAKARKNTAELAGARAAHLRDGAAVTRYLAWLDREAPKGGIDEIAAVTKLEAIRAATQALKEIAFDTISGAGPNGAIVHYRVSKGTNRKLQPGELFLVDSGAQYLDGTTDVTRTIAVGKPSTEMCERFTLVLKGHIALAMARFPAGTRGVQLDTLARTALWQAGLEFDHGTGHGVGSYLSVHEGPQSISKRGMAPLEPGMIVSNEPGYYKEGAYGIRIENLLVVTPPAPIPGGDREMLGFETLTLAPFDRRLIKPKLLSAAELVWLNAYHARVRETIGPELGADDRAWLDGATLPIR